MPIKLDSLIISDNLIGKMHTESYISNKTDIERGFSLCTEPNSDIIVDRGYCTGEKCRIRLPRTCEKDEKFIGSFHTHPGGSSRISGADMMTSCMESVSCISGKYNEIKCHIRKKIQPEWKDQIQQLVCHHEGKEFYNNYEIPINQRFENIKSEADRLRNLVNKTIKDPRTVDNRELNAQILIHNNNIKEFTKDSKKIASILEELINKYFDTIDL